jgi:nucleoside-diphosphate-sugar epimerase
MADQTILFTGAGGFIGRYILAHYLERGDCDLYLLENGRFCERLRAFVELAVADPAKRARAKIIEGDITARDLGLGAPLRAELRDRATHVIHLAALYNLSAPRDVSMRVNVDGTRNLLDFIGGLRRFRRLGYMSTVAISGNCPGGVFREEDLDIGQKFKNFYEETKFLAEKEVRDRWGAIPAVIARPTIAVGHSKTGAIEKIDGPYYGLTMIKRNLHFIGVRSGPTQCHIVPVDYVADAFYTLVEDESTPGRVYCLGDPDPITYDVFFDLACERWGKIKTLVKLPPALMRPVVRLPFFYTITGVTRESFEYSVCPVEYPIVNTTAALAKYGLRCPPVSSYIDVMIRYFRDHYRDPGMRRGDWKKSTT